MSSQYILTGLFGEGPADRRERLRQILAQLGADAIRKERSEALAEKKKRDEVGILQLLFDDIFNPKARITTAADNIHKYFFVIL